MYRRIAFSLFAVAGVFLGLSSAYSSVGDCVTGKADATLSKPNMKCAKPANGDWLNCLFEGKTPVKGGECVKTASGCTRAGIKTTAQGYKFEIWLSLGECTGTKNYNDPGCIVCEADAGGDRTECAWKRLYGNVDPTGKCTLPCDESEFENSSLANCIGAVSKI